LPQEVGKIWHNLQSAIDCTRNQLNKIKRADAKCAKKTPWQSRGTSHPILLQKIWRCDQLSRNSKTTGSHLGAAGELSIVLEEQQLKHITNTRGKYAYETK
jgi:hypothetical protein